MTNTALLNDKIKNSGYKMAFIAEQMSLTRTGLRNKIIGATEFYASEIQVLSDLLKLNRQEREDIFFKK